MSVVTLCDWCGEKANADPPQLRVENRVYDICFPCRKKLFNETLEGKGCPVVEPTATLWSGPPVTPYPVVAGEDPYTY